MEPPEVEYARSGDLSIAYQVVGNGPIDLVFVPLFISPVFSWMHPLFASFYERLAAFSRLIVFDKRGTGASDRPRMPPTLETQMDDVRAVLDAVGSKRAALFGAGHGAQMCALFAATYPERTSQLITWNLWARLPGSPEEHHDLIRRTRDEWLRPAWFEKGLQEGYPSLAGDESFRRAMWVILRASASPGSAAEMNRTFAEADISDVLPTIRVPTLLLYRRRAPLPSDSVSLRESEQRANQMATVIPDARVIWIPGDAGSPFVGDEVTTEVRRFLTSRPAEPVPDRVLATVLFTDIVGSTQRAAALGDRAWRDLLTTHRGDVRRELLRFDGVELDTAGDGFFATFDGPARAITCAQAIVASAAERNLEIRAGIHTGECERESGKLAGIAVHIGARVAALARPREVLVSRTVKDLVAGSDIEFDDRGQHALKGIPGDWRLYAVRSHSTALAS